jgi:CoA:oxalate CoA-transferase
MVDAMIATDDKTHYYLDDVLPNTDDSEVWEATGGPIILAGDFRYIWKQVVRVLRLIDPTPENATLLEKIKYRRDAFSEFLLGHKSRESLVEDLDKANLAWGNVHDTNSYLADSITLKHRNSVLNIDDRHGGTRPTFQSPYRFSEASSGVQHGASFQGEHNASILKQWLGMSDEEISELEANGILISE